MSRSGTTARGRGSRALLVALVAAAVLLPSWAAVARAAGVTFGTPEAVQTYGQSIEFTVPLTVAAGAAGVESVELRLLFPDSLGPYIVDVPVAKALSGTQKLRYMLDLTGGGHLAPNTTVLGTWAARLAGGEMVTSSQLTVLYADTSHTWKTVRGSLVVVHWYDGPQAFAEQELRIGEQAIRDTNALLGVTDTTPVDFFIYGDEASFVKATGPGTRETVVGQARADIRTMFGLITPDTLNDPQIAAAVPHELVHLVFNTAVRNPYRFPPLWINEGLAVYLTEGYSAQRRSCVEDAVRSKDLIPLDALGGQFPADPTKGFLAYCEAVSAIDYLVRVDGQPALVGLVQAYKEGLTDDEVFSKVLGRDLAAFQAGWLEQLGAQQPVRYGPQPAPAGPLPQGWSGSGQSPAPGTSPGAATTTAPTSAPGASSAASPGPTSGSSGDGGAGMVVIAVVVVVVAVAAGLLIARRRTAGP